MTAVPELAKKALDSVVKTVVPDESPTKLDSRRLLILLHGEKASDDLVRAAITRLRNEGHQVSVRVTYEAGDTDRLVKEALLLGTVDTLVAAGGDGTVNEVVAALLTHTGGLKDTRDISDPSEPLVQARGRPPALDKVSVGILPMGTSNDFAATTGIPEDPYEALLLATQASHLRRIDVGLLNGQVFMNTATVGASADVGKITGSGIKKLLGPFAFLVTGMRAVTSWRPVASVMRFPNIKESARYKQQKTSNAQGDLLSQTLGQAVPHVTAHVAAPSGSAEPVTPPAGARIIPSSSLGDMSPGGQSWTPVAQDTLQSVPVTPVVTPSATPAAKAAASETGSAVGELQGVPLLHVSAANNRQVASMVSLSPNAVLDDGMLDLVYVTGDLGARVRRVLFDLIFKGPTKTKVVSTLLRVPWLEVASSEPLEWSLDGEPMPQPATNFRFSLLHRAVYVHLPDDRMLVAGQPEPETEDAALAEDEQHKPKGQLRLPRGKLRPPTLAAMLSSVVKFRKKKNWGAALRGGAVFTLKFLVAASVGGAVAHWWHIRGDTHANSKNEDKDRDKKGKGVGKDGKRGRRRRNVVIADVPVLAPCPP